MSKIEDLYVVNETGYTDRIPDAIKGDDGDNIEFIRTFDGFIVKDGSYFKKCMKKKFNNTPEWSVWQDIHNSLIKVYGKMGLSGYVVTRGAFKVDPMEYCYGHICDTDVIKTKGGMTVLVVRWDTESG